MRPLYEFLGLTVGVVTPFQPPEEKRLAYAADITYGTNNEFGFDYLRDNMAFSMEEKFQRELNFAVIDEVDSRSEEHTSELQSRLHLVCRLLLEKKKHKTKKQKKNKNKLQRYFKPIVERYNYTENIEVWI